MPVVPAFCDNCGTVFGSGILVEDSRNITFTGTRSGPCPNCGGMGHVPDGVYNFIGQTIELLAGPSSTVEDLRRLSDLLENARSKRIDRDELAAAISEETPSLRNVVDLLPRDRSELYGFLSLIIAAATLIVAVRSGASNTPVNVTQVINAATTTQAQTSPATLGPSVAPIARNSPCPCGSGKKYKHCHGKR